MAREIPAAFAAVATQPIRELITMFRVSGDTVVRWRRELGIHVPKGAPRGNGNAIGNQSRQKPTHGMDGPDAVRICLNCTETKCRGQCWRVH